MQPITEDTAKLIIEPHLFKIRKAVGDAITTYYSGAEYASVRYRHSARTDANICHDLIVSNIEREFDGVTGVAFRRRRGLFVLIIDGLVVLKFKKFNRRLMSSNIPTGQSQLVLMQDTSILELPGMPPNGLLHVGYLMNGLSSGLDGIYVTCRYESENLWKWDISEPVKITVPTHEFKAPRVPKRSVTPKTAEKKANSGDGE